MEKRGRLSKITGNFKLGRLPSPFASREAPVGTPQRSRPTTPLSTSSVDVRPRRVTERASPARGNHDEDRRSHTINVILFGEAGVGKSAVVNLIAQREVAKVSPDVRGCTMESARHDVAIDGVDFRLFDTVGLNQPDLVVNSHLEAIVRAYDLILQLQAAGGVHLLLFCMRRGKISLTTRNNYRLFVEFLCQQRVDVAVVVTNCEHEEVMDAWWSRNETEIERLGIKSSGHACVTAVTEDRSPSEELKYRESQQKIRELLCKRSSLNDGAFTLDTMTWVAMVGKEMKNLIQDGKAPKRKDIEKVLSKRVGLRQDTVKKIVEMMEKSDASPNRG